VLLEDVTSLLCTITGHSVDTPLAEVLACADLVVRNGPALTDCQLKKLGAIADLVHFDKYGNCKDTMETFRYFDWCADIRDKVIGATYDQKNCRSRSYKKWAQKVVLDETCVGNCFKQFVFDFSEHELNAKQRNDHQYHPKWSKAGVVSFPSKLRSVINDVSRRYMGNKWAPFRVWQIGLPRMLQLAKTVDLRMPGAHVLQSQMEELFLWFAGLADDVVAREGTEDFPLHRQLAELDQSPLRQSRKQNKKRSRDEMQRGEWLLSKRDDGESYFHLKPEDQTMLEDCETGRLDARFKKHKLNPLGVFRST
jgi:hypothetical protein